MNWKLKAIEMEEAGYANKEIARSLSSFFPGKNDKQVYNSIRSFLYQRKLVRLNTPEKDRPVIEFKEGFEEQVKDNVKVTRFEDGTEEYSRVIVLKESENITAEVVLKAHGLDVTKWEVVTYTNNFWNSQMKGGYKLMMYQSKVVVRPKTQGVDLEYMKEYFENLSIGYKREPFERSTRDLVCNKQAEINIADLHLGRLCHAANGLEPYDSKIAEAVWKKLIKDIFNELKYQPLSRVVLVWCNDFFNIDNSYATTVRGTPMVTDLDFKLLLAKGTELLIWAIEYLLDLRVPIHTFYTPSNHDGNMSFAASLTVKAWFKDEPLVTVDSDVRNRKYIQYGKTLVGYGHGSAEESKGTKYRASTLASCMPVESPDLWSKTLYHEFHVAHLHSEHMIQELNGVIVRRLSSPASYDMWHDEKGYVGAVRKAQTFIYDDEDGLCQVIMTAAK